MRVLCLLFVALLPVALFAGIELSLSRSSCQPGDIVELHAVSSFEELTSFELKLPRHEALHLVAHQRQPVNYVDGVYSQKSIWVLQPMRSGQIEFSGIQAIVTREEGSTELELPSQTIEVVGYAGVDASLTAEQLPDGMPRNESTVTVGFLLLFALVVAVVAAWLFKRRSETIDIVAEEAPALDDLRAALSAGQVPDGLLEALLTDDSLQLSDELRAAMERAAYGAGDALNELDQILGKESRR